MTGELTRWDDDRGFGFITPLDGRPDVFLHVSAFPRALGRPQLGDLLNFSIERADGGKPRAGQVELIQTTATARGVQARPAVRRQSRASRVGGLVAAAAVLGAFAVVLTLVDTRWIDPTWLVVAYATLSILCFVVYAADKSAAVAGRWRISEKTLLGLGLIGGWPGAIVAQQTLRHKIRKRRFMVAFAFTVIANVGLLILLASPLGERALAALGAQA